MPFVNSASSGGGGAGTDGWVASGDTWVFASASTFTITGVDRTATFTPGTRLKLTNTTLKFFVVVSSAFGANTTVTVTGGSDFALANAAITAPSYSYAANPQGYPGWFAFTPVATGFTGSPTVGGRFCVNGREVSYLCSVSGTSNATTFTLTLPIAAVAAANVDALMECSLQGTDNSLTLSPAALAFVATGGGSAMSLFPNGLAGTWTASGTKGVKGSVRYGI